MRRTNLIPDEIARMQSRFTFKTQSDYLLFLAFAAVVVLFIIIFLLQLINMGLLTYNVKTVSSKLANMARSLEENKKSKTSLDAQIKGWQDKTKQAQERIAFLDDALVQRVAWSDVLEKLNTLIPPRLWLVKLSLSQEAIKIKGNTYDNLLISTFISSLSASGFFSDVNLNYTQKKKMRQEAESAISEEVVEFEINCVLIKDKV